MIDENKLLAEMKAKLEDHKQKYWKSEDKTERRYQLGYINALFEVEELIKVMRGDSDD